MITKQELKKILKDGDRYKKKPVPELTVTSFEEGVEIWDHPDVLKFFREKSMKWEPQNETTVFLPCSAHKPYFYSQSHYNGYLPVLLPYLDEIDILVISEPMGVVPYCYTNEYPVDSYDYNPKEYFIGNLRRPLVKKARRKFVERIAESLNKYNEKYEKKILILPANWHLKIVKKAIEKNHFDYSDYIKIKLSGRAHLSVDYMKKQLETVF